MEENLLAYLVINEDAVPLRASLEEISIILDNRKFKRLRNRLLVEYHNDSVGAQQEYVIVHPYLMHLAEQLVNDQLCILRMDD